MPGRWCSRGSGTKKRQPSAHDEPVRRVPDPLEGIARHEREDGVARRVEDPRFLCPDHLGRVHAVLVPASKSANVNHVIDLDMPQRAEEGVPMPRERHVAAVAGPRRPGDVPHRDGERRVVVPLPHDSRAADPRDLDPAEDERIRSERQSGWSVGRRRRRCETVRRRGGPPLHVGKGAPLARLIDPSVDDRREGPAEERETDRAEGDLGPTEPPHDARPWPAARFVRARSPKAPPRDKSPSAVKRGTWLAVLGSCLRGRASATTVGAGASYGFTCSSGVTTVRGTVLYSASFTSSGMAITGTLAAAASSMARRFG